VAPAFVDVPWRGCDKACGAIDLATLRRLRSLATVTQHPEPRFGHMDDEHGTIPQRLAHLEARANTIRGLLGKARSGLLANRNESALQIASLQDLLKSTLARMDWLRSKEP